ncbi:MAG: thiamine-phosphate kinase [Candidatus Thermoplasmatota archaeon]|nr:thiamine-phosphate kinase [Candidatus Thermoplasmatota archaeon]
MKEILQGKKTEWKEGKPRKLRASSLIKLKYIGERKLVKSISEVTNTDISDDCAFIEFGRNYIVVTTDLINEKTHIPKGSTPYQIGWHLVAINLSDLAAKGAKPIGLLTALGIPKDYELNFLKSLAKGMIACARKFNTEIIGGDTKENDILTICGTAVGIVKKEEAMPRKGARVGDIVCVTGKLGRAGIALYKSIPSKVLAFNPRLKEGLALAKTGAVTSCMDISDGLATSLYQLSELNKVGFELYYDKIPTVKSAKRLNIEEFALYSGGDYELLATLKKQKLRVAVEAVKKVGGTLTPIGAVTKDKEIVLVKGALKVAIENRGYEHFV